MTITVSPSSFNGELRANPSKSIMQRVVAISSLTEMPVNIYNPDKSDDSQAAMKSQKLWDVIYLSKITALKFIKRVSLKTVCGMLANQV